jgi:hypothetical protein
MWFIIRFGLKTFMISLRANKYLLAKHLFNDNNGNNMELLKGKQLEHIQDKFIELNSPNVCNLVASFKHRPKGGYVNNILEVEFKSHYDNIQECCFSRQCCGQKVFIFKMLIGLGMEQALVAQMQLRGDLEDLWIMLDHVQCVAN